MNKTIKQELKYLRKEFRYYSDGTPDINSYGVFKAGVTGEEIDNYLRVFLNKMNITNDIKKFHEIAGCNTCPVVTVDHESIGLMYRHDVERYARNAFLKEPTYWD